ncbi:unnamed protein product [Parnassius apollo]|uniref:(apollo) hypothetical protein n=1 Tax=Parnassius apollo TaxID=110799 RepID=A0A8S3YEG9_PARAO|nr:unnamed protein product [Parnassius apollo]
MLWRIDSWQKYGPNECNMSLRIVCDQLLITSENKVLETINMNEKIKDVTSFTTDLPPCFKNFVRLCLLDPSFPKLVQETQNLLNNKINKDSDFTE